MKLFGGLMIAAVAAMTALAPVTAGAVDAADGVQVAQASRPAPAKPRARDVSGADGQANWYGPRFQGKRTASGQRFNMNAMTAAHGSLPFGTRLRVTNLRNGRSVVVRVNDRLGNTKFLVSVSRAAAGQLGLMRAGHAPVKVAVVSRPAPKPAKVIAKAKTKAPTKKKVVAKAKPAKKKAGAHTHKA